MNQEVKKKWIEALRSGKYKKGKGFLKLRYSSDEILHCSLGVLCQLAENELIIKSEEVPLSFGLFSFDDCCAGTPYLVLNWAELPVDISQEIWKMNDEKNLSFNEIADWIEKNL